jgi:hypothetical protein
MAFGQTMLSNQIPRTALPQCANSRKNEEKKIFKNKNGSFVTDLMPADEFSQ